jgi:ABC-type Na+ transport system ATPase subunit NatA
MIVMSRLIPAAERILKARALIQKARTLPIPDPASWPDFSYTAQVKDLMRQARDQVKFLSYSPSTTVEMKEDVAKIFAEADQVEKELLRR